MKSLLTASAAIALLATAVPAAAESYGNLGYTSVDGGDTTVGAVTGRVGWKSDSFFGVEGEVSKGVKDDSTTVSGVTTSTDLDYQYAGYVTGTVPVTPNLDIIGRVGYGQTKIENTTAGVSSDDKADSINYGVGAQYSWGANGIRGDYTRHDYRGSGAGEADAWSVAYVRKF
jgi:hypothetical protein